MSDLMADGLFSLLAFVAALSGMTSFALANDVHWRQLLGTRPQTASARTACKAAGAALLGLSFLLCALADPVTMAMLVWPMMLGVAAALVATFVTLKARRQPPR